MHSGQQLNTSTIAGQNQSNFNQPPIAPGPSSVSNGQNSSGPVQHPPPNARINQQRWVEAVTAVTRLREGVTMERDNQPMPPKNVSEEEKMQIDSYIGPFVRLTTDIDKMLPMCLYLHNDLALIETLVSIVDIAARQHRLLESQTPFYILDINSLKRMYYIANQARERFQDLIPA